ncbi:MAG: AMP-binding protein, partial [Pseudonocardia sp.]|nr:AMP-binding protein [Pseudonocardia sp.]
MPAPDSLSAQAALVPEKLAVIDPEGERLPFAELEARANRLAHGLSGLGLVGGDPVIWCGPNGVDVLVVLHAARKTGLVAVPLAYRFTADEMRYVIADSGAALVLVDPEQAERVAAIRPELPAVREVVVFRSPEWRALLDGPATPPPPPDGTGGSMIYTSGTTGKPKGALRGPTGPEYTRALAATLRLRLHEEVHLTTGPLYHSGPLAWALLTHALGGTVVLLRRFDAARWVELVRKYRVTNTFTAPTPLKRIVSLPDEVLAGADLSSMRSLVINAAPVPYALKQEAIARFGDGFLFEIYGSTELGVDAVLPPEEQLGRPGSCGKALPGVELRIVDADGTELPPGEPGVLQVRSGTTFSGYHGRERLAEGWKSVGDIAHLDDDGYVYIRDRPGDLVITGGMNVYPAEVEAVLHEHPDVLDVAVYGLPSTEWGETVHAAVVPRDGRELDVEALEAHVKQRL